MFRNQQFFSLAPQLGVDLIDLDLHRLELPAKLLLLLLLGLDLFSDLLGKLLRVFQQLLKLFSVFFEEFARLS